MCEICGESRAACQCDVEESEMQYTDCDDCNGTGQIDVDAEEN
jgi:hypothetical protein